MPTSVVARLFLSCLAITCCSRVAVADSSREEVLRVAAEIDRLIAAEWAANSVTPAPRSSDAEFIRRTYLDVSGTDSAVRGSAGLSGRSVVRQAARACGPAPGDGDLHCSLHEPVARGHDSGGGRRSADSVLPARVRGLAPFADRGEPQLRRDRGRGSDSARHANRVATVPAAGLADPVRLLPGQRGQAREHGRGHGADLSGIRLECAQCHDHFFDKWKQDEFWGYAAFFGSLPGSEMMMMTDAQADSEGPVPVATDPRNRPKSCRLVPRRDAAEVVGGLGFPPRSCSLGDFR